MATDTKTTVMNAVRIHEHGDASKLTFETNVPKPQASNLGPRELLVRVHYSSVNFIDTYKRTGLYKTDLPAILGQDASGVVEAKGSEVPNDEFKIGDRVALFGDGGAYAEYVVASANRAAKVPDNVSDEQAVAAMVNGMTAHYLTHDSYHIRKGDAVLVHSAAGGTGQIIVQMAKLLGAGLIIGTCSSTEKTNLAMQLGCNHVVNSVQEKDELVSRVMDLTDGRGVQVVYDGVGKDTWQHSMDALAIRGHLISFGNASGPVPPVAPLELAKKSITLCRPKLSDYVLTAQEFRQRADDLFRWIGDGSIKVNIHKILPLEEAAQAHREIESRRALGKILLRVAQLKK